VAQAELIQNRCVQGMRVPSIINRFESELIRGGPSEKLTPPLTERTGRTYALHHDHAEGLRLLVVDLEWYTVGILPANVPTALLAVCRPQWL